MDDINTATAAAVREAITAADRTELSVAEAADISARTWRRRIGAHTAFTMNELSRVSSTLGVKVVELVAAITEKMR